MTMAKGARLAALLVLLSPASGLAAGARGPEPAKGPENSGRFGSGPARSNSGGKPRDGFGAGPRRGNAGDLGRAEGLGRAENLGRADPAERGGRTDLGRQPARNERASEPRAPERPLREEPTFARLIERVPSLAKIVDKNEKKFKEGLSEGNKAILDRAAEILNGPEASPAAKAEPKITPPESLGRAVREASEAIPKSERGRELEQPHFDVAEARQAPVVYVRAYVRDLQGKSDKAQGHLDKLGEAVARGPAEGNAQGRYEKRPDRKDFTRVMQKVREKDGYASKVYDLAAGRVVYPTMEKLCAGLEHAAAAVKESGATIVRVKERFTDPMSSGYRDVLMNIRTQEGIVAELRFELEPLLKLANEEHLPYEMKRGLDDLASRERRELTPDEKRLKDALDAVTKPKYDEAFARALTAGGRGPSAQPRRNPGRARPIRALPWRVSLAVPARSAA